MSFEINHKIFFLFLFLFFVNTFKEARLHYANQAHLITPSYTYVCLFLCFPRSFTSFRLHSTFALSLARSLADLPIPACLVAFCLRISSVAFFFFALPFCLLFPFWSHIYYLFIYVRTYVHTYVCVCLYLYYEFHFYRIQFIYFVSLLFFRLCACFICLYVFIHYFGSRFGIRLLLALAVSR